MNFTVPIVDTDKLSQDLIEKRGELSLIAVSTRIGISISTLCRLENKVSFVPRLEHYVRLCCYLGKPLEYYINTEYIKQEC